MVCDTAEFAASSRFRKKKVKATLSCLKEKNVMQLNGTAFSILFRNV